MLLQMRTAFTGQIINTKFVVKTDDNFYTIDEHALNKTLPMVLSTYGGGTISNPFSVAYQLNKKLLDDLVREGIA